MIWKSIDSFVLAIFQIQIKHLTKFTSDTIFGFKVVVDPVLSQIQTKNTDITITMRLKILVDRIYGVEITPQQNKV